MGVPSERSSTRSSRAQSPACIGPPSTEGPETGIVRTQSWQPSGCLTNEPHKTTQRAALLTGCHRRIHGDEAGGAAHELDDGHAARALRLYARADERPLRLLHSRVKSKRAVNLRKVYETLSARGHGRQGVHTSVLTCAQRDSVCGIQGRPAPAQCPHQCSWAGQSRRT